MSSWTDKVIIFRTRVGWRWNYASPNGATLAHGQRAYSSRSKAVQAAARVLGFDSREVRYIAESQEIYGIFDLPGRCYVVEVVSR